MSVVRCLKNTRRVPAVTKEALTKTFGGRWYPSVDSWTGAPRYDGFVAGCHVVVL